MFITKALKKIVFKLISNNYSDNDGGNDQDDDCDGPHANAPREGNRDGPLVAKDESTRNYYDGPADDDYDSYDPKESDPHGNWNDDTPNDNHRDSDIQEGDDDDNDDELPLEGDGEDDSREDDCNNKYKDNPRGVMNDQQGEDPHNLESKTRSWETKLNQYHDAEAKVVCHPAADENDVDKELDIHDDMLIKRSLNFEVQQQVGQDCTSLRNVICDLAEFANLSKITANR
ncbi:prostatic spermine-binding protein-like [Tigriopus californicus]|uniref:prostatic spermine-binding protein-like n=1 Tax=Tigriopus californicus TaxID=6832 RepID=UPI0027D9E4FC|nr:prostatic spermine-binding protein-like [Tigriopus californicus]